MKTKTKRGSVNVKASKTKLASDSDNTFKIERFQYDEQGRAKRDKEGNHVRALEECSEFEYLMDELEKAKGSQFSASGDAMYEGICEYRSILGHVGGKSKSDRKTRKARENGWLGGRPRGSFKNERLHEIMRKHDCSRQWAYKLLRKEATR